MLQLFGVFWVWDLLPLVTLQQTWWAVAAVQFSCCCCCCNTGLGAVPRTTQQFILQLRSCMLALQSAGMIV